MKPAGLLSSCATPADELAQAGHLFVLHELRLKTFELGLAVRQFDVLSLKVGFIYSGGALQMLCVRARARQK